MSPILGIWASQNYPRVTNSYESIQTVTVGSAVSSITFSSIPSTYKHLQVRVSGTYSTGGGECTVRYNSDATVTNYYVHLLYGSGSSAVAAADNTNGFGFQLDSSAPGVGVMDILDYADTNKYKTTRNLTGYDANGSGYIILRSGLWKNTAAINSISFHPPGAVNFATNTKFALYGIK